MKKENWNSLKDEYDMIQVPDELRDRVKEAIRMGQEDKRKELVVKRIGKQVLTASAAAMIGLVVLSNSGPSVAYALEKIPVIGSISKVVTFRTYEDSTKNSSVKIEVPQISKDDSENPLTESETEVNNQIKEYTQKLLDQYKADMKELGDGHEAVNSSYKVILNTDNILSIRIDTTISMGGSDSFSKFYHINKKTDEIVTLSSLFKEDADYVTIISDNIKKQMQERMDQDDNVEYFLTTDEWLTEDDVFTKIKEDQNFYINDEGKLVIVFDKYEVAAGYMGIQEFTIPTGVLSGILGVQDIIQ